MTFALTSSQESIDKACERLVLPGCTLKATKLVPNARYRPGKNTILINEYFLDTMPRRERTALLMHEVGHHADYCKDPALVTQSLWMRLSAWGCFIALLVFVAALATRQWQIAAAAFGVRVVLGHIPSLRSWRSEYRADAFAAEQVGAGAVIDMLTMFAPWRMSLYHSIGAASHPPHRLRIQRLTEIVRHEQAKAAETVQAANAAEALHEANPVTIVREAYPAEMRAARRAARRALRGRTMFNDWLDSVEAYQLQRHLLEEAAQTLINDGLVLYDPSSDDVRPLTTVAGH